MIKRIPGSSLPLIFITFLLLYIAYWIFVILLSVFASDVTFSHVIQVVLFFALPFCLSALITLTAFLYLKRDRPTGARQILAIIALTIFALATLQGIILTIFNLLMFLSPGSMD